MSEMNGNPASERHVYELFIERAEATVKAYNTVQELINSFREKFDNTRWEILEKQSEHFKDMDNQAEGIITLIKENKKDILDRIAMSSSNQKNQICDDVDDMCKNQSAAITAHVTQEFKDATLDKENKLFKKVSELVEIFNEVKKLYFVIVIAITILGASATIFQVLMGIGLFKTR